MVTCYVMFRAVLPVCIVYDELDYFLLLIRTNIIDYLVAQQSTSLSALIKSKKWLSNVLQLMCICAG